MFADADDGRNVSLAPSQQPDAFFVPDNNHIVIPLMSFVFGFPLLVITILCLVQQRNKQLQKRESERLHNRRLSTQSTIYTGVTSRLIGGLPVDSASFRPLKISSYLHKDSIGLVAKGNWPSRRGGSFNNLFGRNKNTGQLDVPLAAPGKSRSASNLVIRDSDAYAAGCPTSESTMYISPV
uniref:Uncharacterized protein n=1 Tax=Plectus sambesii TaxID=2011161 RepID=A0A914UI19_9BILA